MAWDTTGPAFAKHEGPAFLLEMLLFTGCTLDEFVNVRREDVYLDSNRIWIRPTARYPQRFVALPDHCRPKLLAYLNHSNNKYLFETREHAPYKTSELRGLVQSLVDANGAPIALPTVSLREALSTWFRSRGELLNEIKELLDHDQNQARRP